MRFCKYISLLSLIFIISSCSSMFKPTDDSMDKEPASKSHAAAILHSDSSIVSVES